MLFRQRIAIFGRSILFTRKRLTQYRPFFNCNNFLFLLLRKQKH